MNIYKSKYIITAHHLDDRIETFFFNLVRWSKLTGLINMTEFSWAILRPLLNVKKSEILEYLDNNKLKYNIDTTNNNIEITRNYLRHKIIPKFEKINSNYKKNINNTLKYFEELKFHIDEEIIKFLNSTESSINSWKIRGFSIVAFNNLSKFIQKEIIRYIYYISNQNSTIWLSNANIKEIIKFINWKGNKTIKEIRNLKMKKDNKIIIY
jgi:tRNA(Ile)-lysidine synthase TilS/MesJ